MAELVKIGGVAPLMKALISKGLMHGDCLTVTGKTIKNNLNKIKPYPLNQKIIKPISDPIKKDGHLIVLRGNIAPDGAIAKFRVKRAHILKVKLKSLILKKKC